MTTYITADTYMQSPVNIPGFGAATFDTVVDPLFTSVQTDIESQMNVLLGALHASDLTLIGASAAGAGMGDLDTLAMLGKDDDTAFIPFEDPLDGTGTPPDHGGHYFIYKAETEPELTRPYAACKARVVAFINGMAGNVDGYYVDHWLVGAKHGGFMGVFFIWRSIGLPQPG